MVLNRTYPNQTHKVIVGPVSVTESLVKVQGLWEDFSPLTATWCPPPLLPSTASRLGLKPNFSQTVWPSE
ncbi:hypothetical protein CsSME_00016143 [Camellia sinensis var. sinensis]